MKAVRLREARALEVVDLPDPVANADEVLLRVAACGICGSDLSCYKNGIFAGVVPGHELSAVVESSNADGWASGSHVVVDPKTPCGSCDDCVTGNAHRCVRALTHGVGQALQGGFAERIAVPSSLLHRVPDGLDLTVASLAEPLAVALHGLGTVEASTEPTVVYGLGPIGLLTCAVLATGGASPIVGVDPVEGRRVLAEGLGVDLVVEPGDPRIADVGASLVVETSGSARAIADAGNVARPGGRVLLLGIPMGSVEVWPMVWVTREIAVVGSVGQSDDDFAAALSLLEREPGIGEIITARIGLDDVPDAFERLTTNPDAGKITVVP